MLQEAPKPFTQSHVLRITAKYVLRDIETSIRKTYARVAEFADDREKSAEILKTLSMLHGLKQVVENFRTLNKAAFNPTEESNDTSNSNTQGS